MNSIECEIKELLPISEMLNVQLRTIEAITIGSTAMKTLTMEGVIGQVCGVFARTVNVLTETKELLTLARKDTQNSPITILLDLPSDIGMSTFGVRTGSSVVKLGQFIHISESEMLISLAKATLWKAQRQIKTSLAIKDIVRNCEVAKDIGSSYGKRGGLSGLLEYSNALAKGETIEAPELNVYSRIASSRVTMLVKAVLSRNLTAVPLSANSLIGLGPGVTPSCDDMLLGFMSSLLLVTGALSRDVHYAREVNRTIVSSVNGQTTLLSQKLLEHAALGETPELTYNVIEAAIAGTEEQVRKATSELLAVGHSSGTDTLLGILLGFYVAMNIT